MLTGDSGNYEVLWNAAKDIKGVDGFTIELGVRFGYGSVSIINGLLASGDNKHHVGVDPFGYIEYSPDERREIRVPEYTNRAKQKMLAEMYQFCCERRVEFSFFAMTDEQFFKIFHAGIPVYDREEVILNKYSLVHYDGPHTVDALNKEIDFFISRTPQGGYWVFDDVVGYYDHSVIDLRVKAIGFVPVEETKHKISYRREHE